MRNSLVIFSLVICLSINGIQLTHPRVEIVQNTNSQCIPGIQNHTEMLSRKKRYLLFEKGAALSITAASVKPIISGIPRGLNIISEESIYYDLPSSVLIPKIESTPSQSTKSPSTKMEMKRKLIQNFPPVSVEYSPPYHMYKYKRNVHSTGSKENVGDNYSDSLNIEILFFEQLEKFAEMYGYNGGHCIMRTICEAKHFLYPMGQSLYHDIIRIILKFALPTIRSNEKYLTSSKTVNPRDCAKLYGPHCRISFLDYFTVQIHGKFM